MHLRLPVAARLGSASDSIPPDAIDHKESGMPLPRKFAYLSGDYLDSDLRAASRLSQAPFMIPDSPRHSSPFPWHTPYLIDSPGRYQPLMDYISAADSIYYCYLCAELISNDMAITE